MGHFAEPVHDSEYDRVIIGAGQAGEKIHGQMRPRMTQNGKGLQGPRRGLVGVLVLIADDAGPDVLPSVIFQGRPPKSLAK